MYEIPAREAAELFDAHLDGAALPLACVVSASPLPARAQDALRKSLHALGYGERGCTFATLEGVDGTLDASALFLMLEGLDPLCLVAADEAAAHALEAAYRCPVPLERPVRLLGRSCIAFRSFDALLGDPHDKQIAWALLKKLPRRGIQS